MITSTLVLQKLYIDHCKKEKKIEEKQRPNPGRVFIFKKIPIIFLYYTKIHYLYVLLKLFLYIILKNCPYITLYRHYLCSEEIKSSSEAFQLNRSPFIAENLNSLFQQQTLPDIALQPEMGYVFCADIPSISSGSCTQGKHSLLRNVLHCRTFIIASGNILQSFSAAQGIQCPCLQGFTSTI